MKQLQAIVTYIVLVIVMITVLFFLFKKDKPVSPQPPVQLVTEQSQIVPQLQEDNSPWKE